MSQGAGAPSGVIRGMDSLDAIRTLQSMGLRVSESTGGFTLSVQDHSLGLGPVQDWRDALLRASEWLDELGERARLDGESLATRRKRMGFGEATEFCRFSGLDPVLVEEAEAGLMPAQIVHERILDWLESGRLRAG